jgi:phosphatidylserine/phosphatidylglycerophosphate/cardiolipin synthase-like enzyme
VAQPDACAAPLVRFIAGAHTTLQGEIYLVTAADVLAALDAAPARGVHVHLLLEHYPFGPGKPSPEETFARLKAHGVDVRWAPRRFRFTHAKWLLRDGQQAWIGTMNWSAAAFTTGRGFAVIMADPTVDRQLAAVFAADWQDRALTGDVSHLVVSPLNSRQKLDALISSARSTLDIYAEVLNDPPTTSLLADAAKRGVRVRVVWPGTGNIGYLARSGAQVVICSRPYIHAKTIVADGARVYVGSINFTAASFHQNREVGLIMHDTALAAGVEQFFAADFAAGKPAA